MFSRRTIHFVVVSFPSHLQWVEGYEENSIHDVVITKIPSDRWKWRFQIALAEIIDDSSCDVLVVDGMLDLSALPRSISCKTIVYLHENQMTTPWSSQDRDVQNGTSWHFGMAHWRSLLLADGFVFNTNQHRKVFGDALLALIQNQCPRDSVQWHLNKASELLQTKCSVLTYGLRLQELKMPVDRDNSPPILLWNARLEEDKNPAEFLRLLPRISVPFRLVVLGADSTNDQKWAKQFQTHQPLFLGWCSDRSTYGQWLSRAKVVVSTAFHETFGISMAESAYAGVIPVLPNRLSYPELFNDFPELLYQNTDDCLEKIENFLTMNGEEHTRLVDRLCQAMSLYDWNSKGQRYDTFFDSFAANGDVVSAAAQVNTASDTVGAEGPWIQEITSIDDSRVALYRPKSLRNHVEYNQQIAAFGDSIPVLHGGRRAMVRMLEAIETGSKTQPVTFLTTRELATKYLTRCKVPCYVATKRILDKVRGQKLNAGDAILAMVQFPIASQLAELNPPILFLDDLRNAENVGSILRTAFCLGITSVVASPVSWAALRDSRAARCSMGTIFYHRFVRSENLAITIAEVQKMGVTVYGIEISESAVPVTPHGDNKEWAAVLSNEDTGMSLRVAESCSQVVFVPQAHGDSLNVGHAAAITLFELGRGSRMAAHDGQAACT